MDSIRPLLPAGVRLEPVYDQGALVRDSIASVRDAMLVGGALAVLVLLLFLGEWRTTRRRRALAPAHRRHHAARRGARGRFAQPDEPRRPGRGYRHHHRRRRRRGREHRAPSRAAPGRVAGRGRAARRPTRSSARSPARPSPRSWSSRRSGLLTGVVGEFFRSFAIALAVAVLLSLALAMTLIPAVVAQWAARAADAEATRRAGGFPGSTWRAWRSATVGRSAGCWAHRARRARRVGGGAAGRWGWPRARDRDRLPPRDGRGRLHPRLLGSHRRARSPRPTGRCSVLEGILLEDPDGAGVHAPHGERARASRPRRPTAATSPCCSSRAASGRLGLRGHGPGARRGGGAGAGGAGGVHAAHAGRDRRPGRRAGAGRAQALQPGPGGRRARRPRRWRRPSSRRPAWWTCSTACRAPTPSAGSSSIRRASRGSASRAGEVQAQARAALFGADAGTAREPDRLVPIRVRLARQRAVPGRRGLAGADRGARRLAAARRARQRARHRRRRASCCAKISGPMSRVTGTDQRAQPRQRRRDVRRAPWRVPLPAGVTLEIGGQYASQQAVVPGAARRARARRSARCCCCWWRSSASFRGPLAHHPRRAARPHRRAGHARRHGRAVQRVELHGRDSAGRADRQERDPAARRRPSRVATRERTPPKRWLMPGRVRLRPILMTTVCTLAGLVPLALGLGAGAELQRPLALAVIGGLVRLHARDAADRPRPAGSIW